eukprot:CAMPEP_0176357828 /NCGR_PEP_ID=MMETSP0126-20121128/15082_1 /TAXON_ID=141414 ORGANISM="Strombidinopsis acuminatum, Strain SPMC142" /NCGR_SAMPLE_ID=MMETSP0126 /ASSEMBLY_ACC=CAM_ASM_000229 /LENGTH=47 /DNA_ID= /DNA_START= /DNA_END= /DNA_ORIENTATION=
MEDIEDLFKNEADQLEKRTDKRRVIKSTRPKNKKLNNEDNQESNDTN